MKLLGYAYTFYAEALRDFQVENEETACICNEDKPFL
jgi:hypothetical protein